MTVKGDRISAQAVAAQLKADARAETPFARCVSNGWSFVYSVPCKAIPYMGLSAQLWPVGRGSKEHDWFFLGQVMGAIGVPVGSCAVASDVATADPNSVLKWLWAPEEKSSC